ncbi:MAG: dipeptidase [Bacteroidales bacterium]
MRFLFTLYLLGFVVGSLDCQSVDSEVMHDKVLSLDTHVDTPSKMYKYNIANRYSYDKTGLRLDIPRLIDGGLDAMFLIVYLPQGYLTEYGYNQVVSKANLMFDRIHNAINTNSKVLELATSSEDFYNIPKRGKRAVFIGVENGYAIGHNLDNVDSFYRRGARYMTLGHTSNNDICCSSTDESGKPDSGLTEFGYKLVERMNKLGMLVDISHVSDKTFYDVVKYSKTPIVASHSSCRALRWNKRNMSDDMIKALAEKGGVIQICMVRRFIKSGTDVRVSDFVDHIEHVVRLVGVDYVGIATDFDGGGGLPDFYDATCYPRITAELVKRGYSHEAIQKIWGGNFMRVLKTNELYSKLLEGY